MGYSVAESQDGDAPAVRHLVEEGRHLLDALALGDDLLDRRTSAQVQGDEAAGKLGDPVLETSSFTEPSEDLERLAVLVRRDGDE